MPPTDNVPRDGNLSIDQAINLLFLAYGERSGKELSNKQVADAINARAGQPSISEETIRKLRHKGGPSPSLEKVGLLADFFNVPLDFFRTGKIQGEVIRDLEKMREQERRAREAERQYDDHTQFLARKFGGLTPMGQGQVIGFIQGLMEAQQGREQQDGT